MQLKMVLPGDTNEIIEEREMFALSHIKNKKVVGLTSFLQQHSAVMVFSFTVPDTRAVAVSFDQRRTGCCKDLGGQTTGMLSLGVATNSLGWVVPLDLDKPDPVLN
mgnify:CR=1 FL=1